MKPCPHCDTRNPDGSGYCRSCGQALGTVPPETMVAETRRQRLLEADSCPSCGAEVPGGYAFCPGCGEDVRTAGPSGDGTQGDATAAGAEGPQADQPPGAAVRDASLLRIVEDGEVAGTYPLEPGQTVIGREQGDLRFPTDVFLSNPHARLFFDEGRLYVEDLGSVNGVFLRVEQPQTVRPGDLFILGRQLLRLDGSPFEADEGRAGAGRPDAPIRTLEESPEEEVEDPPAGATSSDPSDRTARYGFPPQEVVGCLTALLSDGKAGSRFLLDGREVILGRERGDIVFTRDHYMSNEHAALRRDNGAFVLEDLGSRNGTFLGVRQAAEVGDGASLLIGRQLFRIRLE